MHRPWLVATATLLLMLPMSLTEAQSLPGDLVQSTPFNGTQPIDLCHVPGSTDLYVLDGSDGLTYVYDLNNLAAGATSTVPNPVGTAATTGITSDGVFLYWAVPGAAQTYWRTDLLGGSPTPLGSFALPGLGSLIGICFDADGNLWANDATNDTYSMHSIADGSWLGASFQHPDGAGSGGGIAYRTDCALFEIPHGAVGAGGVGKISSLLAPAGVPIEGIDVSFIGPLVRGVEAVEAGSTGAYSVFLIEGSTNQVYEILGTPPCPTPAIPEAMDVVRCSQPALPGDTFCSPAPVALLDLAATTDSVNATAGFLIGDLDLSLDLTHPVTSDLAITLTAPGGTTLTLHDGLAGPGDINLIFDDEGAPYGSSSLSGGTRMRPAGPGLLAVFHGLPFSGLWTLTVTDSVAGNTGTLNSWCLTGNPTPGILIDPVGVAVADTITITEATTTLRDVNVSVEITHPFVGDLLVTISGPTGTTVALHDQSVSTMGGISETYDDDGFGTFPDGPGLLSDFVGTPANGDWVLTARDDFVGSVGTLDGWCLFLDDFTRREVCHEPPRASDCVAPGALINNTAPVTSVISTLLTGQVRDLDVALDVQHSWIGDLDIVVESPAATSIVLLSSGNGNIDDIHTTFDDEGSPFNPVLLPGATRLQPQGPGALTDFDGEAITGSWTLTTIDGAASDNGILQSWCLDTQTPLAITNGGGPLVVPLEMPDDILIEDAELHLEIEHPATGHLQMSLLSPSGDIITLTTVNPIHSTGINVTFASDGVPFDPALLGNGLRMQPALGSTLDFTGDSMLGTWTLSIIDAIAGADGVLSDACLRILGDETPCQPPQVIPSASGASGPSPLTVNFTSSTTGTPPIAISWNFADGNTAFEPNPTHTFLTEGTYPVTVTVSNACGTAQSTIFVLVCNPVLAAPSADLLSGPPPLLVNFTAGTSGTAPLTHAWEFGDGGTSSDANPSHLYTTAGTFVVNLTATNTCGLVQQQLIIEVCDPVTALPSATPAAGAPPLEVVFTSGATGSGPIFHSWEFGDGGTSSVTNPTHLYAAEGEYLATLTVTNSCGTDVHTIPVSVCAPAATAATASTTSGTLPLIVSFDANASGTAPVSVLWDFGDGTSSTAIAPAHTYTTDGVFTASVTATNACGTTTESFTISPCAPVIAAPTATPENGAAPLIVAFDANASGTGPINAVWTFGDGSISTDLNPIHTFESEGTYSVSVTISNPCGSESTTIAVTVCETITLTPTADFTIGNAPLTVTFASGETGSAPIATNWDFGDTGTAAGPIATHTFTTAGLYVVSVASTNSCSNVSETLTIEVCETVGTTPNASLGAGGNPTAVQFLAQPSGSGPFSYAWSFGDGATSSLENPLHDYVTPGNYTATLTVSNPCGSDSASTTIDLCMTPTAAFTASSTFGIAPFCVDFDDQSNGEIASSTWNFGDGTTDPTIGSTSHTYEAAGLFDVSLSVANSCAVGTTQTAPQLIQVLLPGDVNADGDRDITDPISMLGYIFSGGEAPPCFRTADVNVDGFIDIADTIYLLFYLFAEGQAPQAPPCGDCNF